MDNSFLCAFSSDARDLYQADIFRVMALPNDAVIQFRYKTSWVDPNVAAKADSLLDREVLIFYNHDSDQNIPVRRSTIVHAQLCEETKLIKVHLKLGSFCDYLIDSSSSVEKLPPYKFLSELQCTIGTDNTWADRVSALRDYFPLRTFFRVDSITYTSGCFSKKERPVKISRFGAAINYYFPLEQGKRYQMNFDIANPKNSDGVASSETIRFKSSSTDVVVNYSNPIVCNVDFDSFSVPIFVGNSSSSTQSSVVTFSHESSDEELSLLAFDVNLEFASSVSRLRAAKFGLYTIIAFIGLLFLKGSIDDLMEPDGSVGLWDVVQPIICAVIAGFGAAQLHRWFNKK